MRCSTAKPSDAVRMSAKNSESYAEMLNAVKAKVDPQNAGAEILSIRRTRREVVAKECKAPHRCLTCADRGEKDVAHASGSSSGPVFRAEFRRLRDGK